MKIRNIEWKNFNGYGNVIQKIDFTKEGQLYLLVGQNGSGKSSIAEAITYGLYGKVEGKRLGDLANRINRGMEVTIQLSAKGKEITIRRGIMPNYFELFINGTIYDQAGNKNVQDYLETEILDIPYQVFKNIIILSVNDFKSFLTMSSGDKRNIVDRLFGFTIINHMRESIREKRRDAKQDIQTLYDELNILDESITSINQKIELLKKENRVDQTKLIGEYEDKLVKVTDKHANTLKILKKLNNKYIVLEKIVQEKSRDESTLINDLSFIKKSIDLFERDKCPTCGNDFHGPDYDHTRKSFNKQAKEKKTDLITIREELTTATDNLSKCTKFVKDSKDSITRLETLIGQYEFELNSTISKSENKDFQYLKQLINENTETTKSKNDLKYKREINEKFLEVVENILGEDGVKNLALKTILPPLNASIDSMVKQMHIPHRIKFDEKFNCKITSLGEEINPNTMSTGERKKSDFIIIIAMIKLLKVRYPSVNMLFLDEIFSSIDGAGIHEIIGILKETVQETGLNTWVINHSELPVNLFDIKAEAYKEGGFSKLSLESIV
jgi:DNA repair exonuclease SbcCD ATPase subunit